jgi:hypothetical protein
VFGIARLDVWNKRPPFDRIWYLSQQINCFITMKTHKRRSIKKCVVALSRAKQAKQGAGQTKQGAEQTKQGEKHSQLGHFQVKHTRRRDSCQHKHYQ